MKFLKPISLLGVLIILGLISLPLHAGQQDSSQSPGQSPSTQSQPQDQSQQAQTFTGKIMKSKGSVVLKDDSSSTAYKLDSEDQAKQYIGKNVKVTGTLDPATNTIHVSNITPASASSY
jgi:lipopolysaccharide export system protein LptA